MSSVYSTNGVKMFPLGKTGHVITIPAIGKYNLLPNKKAVAHNYALHTGLHIFFGTLC